MSDAITNAFELLTGVTTADQLRPIEWSLEEAMDEGFKLMLTALSPIGLGDELATKLFGQRATFVVHGPSPLVRRGAISAVSLGGTGDGDNTELRITMVSRLDLMQLRTTSRIFSDVSTIDVLETLAKDWHLPHELRFERKYTKRRYITQYRETDFDFLRRITSREGIGFFLEHADYDPKEREAPGTEKLVFFDHAQAYRPLPDGEDHRLGHRLVHDRTRFESHEHHVSGFRLERTIAPEHIRLGDFDFRKPRLQLRAAAILAAPLRSPINTSLGGERLSVYLHADRAELDLEGGKGEISDALAQVRLEQAQRESSIGRGDSQCLRLAPGRAFTLEEQNEAPSLNQGYAVLRVYHRGHLPEVVRARSSEPGYSNRFECIPDHVVYRSRLPKLDLRQATETATVVGPSGGDIHCDEFGRVRVLFHWDAGGDPEGKRTTWLRVVQPWAGANWGSQFIPRIGMEVLVGFLSGDVDQPIVVGAVYNGTHPTPFELPEHASKAGVRSQSTPGADGNNEISFEDKKGHEKIYVHAQRDMIEQVDHDFERKVDHNETILVKGNASHTVQGSSSHAVLGSHVQSVAMDLVANVAGSATLSAGGDSDARITGNRGARIEGREILELKKDRQTIVTEDDVHRVLGHLITVVGQDGARTSAVQHVEGETRHSSTSTYEIASDKEILLRCGSSSIRLSADGIDLIAKTVTTRADNTLDQIEKEAVHFVKKQFAIVTENVDVVASKKVVASGEKGMLRLDKDAHLDGGKVKINCDPEPPDSKKPPEFKPPVATTIEVSDESGGALGGKRFIVRNKDKTERSGTLDKDGKAEIFLDESAEIFFPDVDTPRRA